MTWLPKVIVRLVWLHDKCEKCLAGTCDSFFFYESNKYAFLKNAIKESLWTKWQPKMRWFLKVWWIRHRPINQFHIFIFALPLLLQIVKIFVPTVHNWNFLSKQPKSIPINSKKKDNPDCCKIFIIFRTYKFHFHHYLHFFLLLWKL